MTDQFEGHIIKQFNSKTGKEIVIRYPVLSDAESMTHYINEVSQERTYISFQGEQMSIEEETEFLKKELEKIQQHTAIFLLAFDGDTLVGSSGIDMDVRTQRHIGLFGISLHKESRGQGIGRILMDTVIDEAKKNIPELEILTLTVFAHNGRACALYESLGFVRYGLLPGGVKLPDGYADHVYMYKRVR